MFAAQAAPPVLTPVANKKILNQKQIFIIYFGTPMGSRVSI
jgi:hypothetical protein